MTLPSARSSRPGGRLPPFWRLVELHADELLAHARRMVGDDSEDVVQEALLRALRSYDRITDPTHLRAWLYRIVTTTAFDHGRAQARHGRALRAQPPPSPEYPVYDDGTFDRLLEGAPDGARSALRLRFVDDLSYDQIAERLGCSAAAARQRVSSAVRALREAMA